VACTGFGQERHCSSYAFVSFHLNHRIMNDLLLSDNDSVAKRAFAGQWHRRALCFCCVPTTEHQRRSQVIAVLWLYFSWQEPQADPPAMLPRAFRSLISLGTLHFHAILLTSYVGVLVFVGQGHVKRKTLERTDMRTGLALKSPDEYPNVGPLLSCLVFVLVVWLLLLLLLPLLFGWLLLLLLFLFSFFSFCSLFLFFD
jgi:hypothetical protein